jgi:hypothetical protein
MSFIRIFLIFILFACCFIDTNSFTLGAFGFASIGRAFGQFMQVFWKISEEATEEISSGHRKAPAFANTHSHSDHRSFEIRTR